MAVHFWINLPVGLAALALTARFVPESRAPHPRRIDPVGQLLVIVALATVTYAIIEGHRLGWNSPAMLALGALAAAALAGLVWYEPRRREPLLEVRFFRSVPFSGATMIAVSAFAALGGFLFLNTLYLQDVRGLSALHAGLYTLPMALMTVIFAPLSGRLVSTRDARLPLVSAGVLLTSSSLLLTRLAAGTPVSYLLIAYVLFGAGFGLVNTPITNTAVSGMPRAQAGVAAAIASTSRQIGQTLGVAVVGAAATAGLHGSFRSGFAQASHPGWWMLVGCGVAVLALGFATTTGWARATLGPDT